MAVFIASFNIYFLLYALCDFVNDVRASEESTLAHGAFRASTWMSLMARLCCPYIDAELSGSIPECTAAMGKWIPLHVMLPVQVSVTFQAFNVNTICIVTGTIIRLVQLGMQTSCGVKLLKLDQLINFWKWNLLSTLPLHGDLWGGVNFYTKPSTCAIYRAFI